jgi:hypothetical protein
MKKTLVSFTISFACLIGFCNLANADIVGQSWDVTMADVESWKVAKLLGSQFLYVRSTKSELKETVFKNYVNGYSTVATETGDKIVGDRLSYGDVKHISSYGEDPLPNYTELITPADAKTGNWTRQNTTEPITTNNLYNNGYNVFKTEFSLSPEISDLSGLFLNIDLDIFVDDYLEGVFLNGYEITKYSSLSGSHGLIHLTPDGLSSFVPLELTGSVLLDDLIAQGLFLTDGPNTLEFITLNEYYFGSSLDNPYSFGTFGNIDVGEQQFANSFNPTPEPATLLICLTCGGLALAIRRRKNKKTE